MAERHLTVEIQLNEATSRLTATVRWTFNGGTPSDSVSEWQMTVKNLTWLQNDFTYDHWVYRLDQRTYSGKNNANVYVGPYQATLSVRLSVCMEASS